MPATEDVLVPLHRYAHALDYGRVQEWADCFTEDGLFEVGRVSEAGFRSSTTCRGRRELLAFAASHSHAPQSWHKHLLLCPVVTVHGSEAAAAVASYFVRLDAGPQGPFVYSFGRYLDEVVRCPDGRWRLRKRVAEIESMGPGAEPHGILGP